MGSSIAIVNGTVNITAKTDMDAEMLQRVVDQFLTITGDFNYTSEASTIAEVTFTNLSGVQSMTLRQAGGYVFPALTSAKDITLEDNFENSVDIIDFRELTSVSNFYTNTTEDLIQFTKAVELHLTKLERYDTSSSKVLTLEVDEGGVIDISALDDVATDGDQEDIYLSITGPSSISISNLTDGALTFTSVPEVTVNGFEGSITIGADVESLTADKVTALTMTAAVDLETLDITGALDPDVSDDEEGPSITFSSHANIETVDLDGTLASVTLEDNGNLASVTIAADVTGAVTIGSTTGNDDLTSVTLTGSKMTSLSVKQNGDLVGLTVDTTWRADNPDDDTTPTVDGSLTVSDNPKLTSLTVSSDNLETLTVTNNAKLTTLDFTGVTKIGATAESNVNIYNNDLTATKAENTDDGATNADNGASGDLGSFTSTSGMSTLKTYLTAVDAEADATAYVFFDTVESSINEDDSEDTDQTWNNTNGKTGTQSDAIKVLIKKANTAAAGKDAVKSKKSYVLDEIMSTASIGLTVNGVDVFGVQVPGEFTDDASGRKRINLTGNLTLDLARLNSAAVATRATAAGITLTAAAGGTTKTSITFSAITSATANSSTVQVGERYTVGQQGTGAAGVVANIKNYSGLQTPTLGTDDYVTVTVGSNSVTATGATATAIADAIEAAWVLKYDATGGWKSASGVFSVTNPAAGQVVFTSQSSGSLVQANDVTVSVSTGTATGTTGYGVNWTIGETIETTDNKTIDTNKDASVMITLESVDGGSILDKLASVTASSFAFSNLSVSATLTSTRVVNSNGAGDKKGLGAIQTEARADAQSPEGGVDAAASNAVDFNRVGWL